MLIISQLKNRFTISSLSSIEDTDYIPEADKIDERLKRNLDVAESTTRQRWAMNRSGSCLWKKPTDFRSGGSIKSTRATKPKTTWKI